MHSNTVELKRLLMVSDIKLFNCLYINTGIQSRLQFLFFNVSIIFEFLLASEMTNSKDLSRVDQDNWAGLLVNLAYYFSLKKILKSRNHTKMRHFFPKKDNIGSIKARDRILASSGLNGSHGSVIGNARFIEW